MFLLTFLHRYVSKHKPSKSYKCNAPRQQYLMKAELCKTLIKISVFLEVKSGSLSERDLEMDELDDNIG